MLWLPRRACGRCGALGVGLFGGGRVGAGVWPQARGSGDRRGAGVRRMIEGSGVLKNVCTWFVRENSKIESKETQIWEN